MQLHRQKPLIWTTHRVRVRVCEREREREREREKEREWVSFFLSNVRPDFLFFVFISFPCWFREQLLLSHVTSQYLQASLVCRQVHTQGLNIENCRHSFDKCSEVWWTYTIHGIQYRLPMAWPSNGNVSQWISQSLSEGKDNL